MEKLPNFLVVGFPKCGSTSLHYYLDAHPEIFMPKQKELHYFSNDVISKLNKGPKDKYIKKLHVQNSEDYKAQFVKAQNNQAVGEISPSYINYPEECIPKIKDLLGQPKIIIVLRDPIKRAYSNYLHLLRENRETLSFYNALLKEEGRKKASFSDFWYYAFNSDYYNKVKAYVSAFDDVLILESELLKKNTQHEVARVYNFLEVSSKFKSDNLQKTYNEGGVYEQNLVTKFFFEQSKVRDVARKIVPASTKMKHLKQKLVKRYKKETPEIDKKAEEYLVNLLRKETKRLKDEFKLTCLGWTPELFN